MAFTGAVLPRTAHQLLTGPLMVLPRTALLTRALAVLPRTAMQILLGLCEAVLRYHRQLSWLLLGGYPGG